MPAQEGKQIGFHWGCSRATQGTAQPQAAAECPLPLVQTPASDGHCTGGSRGGAMQLPTDTTPHCSNHHPEWWGETALQRDLLPLTPFLPHPCTSSGIQRGRCKAQGVTKHCSGINQTLLTQSLLPWHTAPPVRCLLSSHPNMSSHWG